MNGLRDEIIPGNRAQSTVLGFALLFGIVLLGVTSIVLLGGSGIADLERTAESERAQSVFAKLDAQASQVALGDSTHQSIALGDVGEAGSITSEASGRIVLESDSGTEYVNQTLGAVVYEREGNNTITYQGGGVWRGSGNQSRMISPPEFHYRDGTLTLPIVVVNPTNKGAKGEGRLGLAPNGSRYELTPGVVKNEILTIRITSSHYVAWGTFFKNRIDGVTVSYDHGADTVEIQLANLGIDGNYNTGVVAEGDVTATTGSSTINSEVETSGSVSTKHANTIQCDDGTGADCTTEGVDLDETALDLAIEKAVNSSANNDPVANIGGGPKTLSAGSYYSEGFLLDNGELTLDLSSGNVTLFVDGNIGLDGQRINVVNGAGTNHYAKILTRGDFAMAKGGAGVTVDSGNATRFQLFGTSELHFAMGQSNTNGYTGTVYAPRDAPADGSNDAVAEYGMNSISCPDQDVCLGTGSGTFNGAVIAGPTTVGQSATLDYAEELAGHQPSLPGGAALPPPAAFLHVSVNRIDATGVPGDRTVTLPEPNLFARLTVRERDSNSYTLDAKQSTPRHEINEYRWDFDDDGTVDRTTSDPKTVVSCDSELDCSSPPDQARVTVANTEFGVTDTARDSYSGSPVSNSIAGFSDVTASDMTSQESATGQTITFTVNASLAGGETVTINLDDPQDATGGGVNEVDYRAGSDPSVTVGGGSATLSASNTQATITYTAPSGGLDSGTQVSITLEGATDDANGPYDVEFSRSDDSGTATTTFSLSGSGGGSTAGFSSATASNMDSPTSATQQTITFTVNETLADGETVTMNLNDPQDATGNGNAKVVDYRDGNGPNVTAGGGTASFSGDKDTASITYTAPAGGVSSGTQVTITIEGETAGENPSEQDNEYTIEFSRSDGTGTTTATFQLN